MDKIIRHHRSGDVEYSIMSLLEAKELGIVYVHWKEVKEDGEWVVTDDEWVCKCYKTRVYKKHERVVRVIDLPFGTYFSNKDKVLYETRRGTGKFRNKEWYDYELSSSRGKRLVREAVDQLFTVGKLDYQKLGTMYRQDQRVPEWSVRRVLKQKVFMDAIEEGLEERLIRKGMNPDYVVDLFKKVVEYADERKDPDALLKVAKEIRAMLGLEPKRRSVTESIESTNIQYLKDNVDREEEKLKLTRTTSE